MSGDLFDSFSQFGDRILVGIDHEERPALKYKYLLGSINELLGVTHGIVVRILERVEKASGPDEARSALAELNMDALEESFRLEGLCDAFDAMGMGLSNLTWTSQTNGDSVAPDTAEIQEFARMLTDREQEVARIYSTQIQELVNLDDFSDLPDLRRRVAEAKSKLTNQMADFAYKSQRFKRIAR